MEWFIDFFTATPWWELLIIFGCKMLEVAIMTVRIIIVNRGYKLIGSILAFVEVLLWIFVASQVIVNISAEPLKGIVYSVAFAVGIYVGSIIEKKLAFGKIMIQVILPSELADEIVAEIRKKKIGVTTIAAKGVAGEKTIAMIYVNRKNSESLKKNIMEQAPSALIAENDIVDISGGTMTSNMRRRVIK
ncbi:MAG TPA: DUF2179 domain-containing protein [Acholeplasmataceae bacterium]|nr:DUF2179 domain-containing protein [Acholeplasmataceae bacterium]